MPRLPGQPLSDPAVVLAELAGRDRESARGLEAFAACGVRWVVEQLLRRLLPCELQVVSHRDEPQSH